MPKTPELSYINFMSSPKLWLFKFAWVPDYKIPPPPPCLLVQDPGEYSKLQVTGMIKGFSIPGFFGVFKTIWRFVVSARVLRPPSPINCFYFSCYLNAFWKFLRFRNSAWDFLGVWFLLPFDHPRHFSCHLKSVVSPPGPRKSIHSVFKLINRLI